MYASAEERTGGMFGNEYYGQGPRAPARGVMASQLFSTSGSQGKFTPTKTPNNRNFGTSPFSQTNPRFTSRGIPDASLRTEPVSGLQGGLPIKSLHEMRHADITDVEPTQMDEAVPDYSDLGFDTGPQPVSQEPSNWVVVFGFAPSQLSFILKYFGKFGDILQHQAASVSGANWVNIQYCALFVFVFVFFNCFVTCYLGIEQHNKQKRPLL
eukprot:TRINITY_DN11106_c0_g1_i2.p1 TRINITY_DN11106_c0_g1~~TRINITY_DN11106_c0_g1_i2.p1  ORF type:complete len:211 (+),score=15.33 TRINITY_DN11106_c0_g1_i2:44-676(+)